MNPCVRRQTVLSLTALLLLFAPALASAQGTRTNYERADSFNVRTRGLVVDVAEGPNWIEETSRFWYRKTVDGGNTFVLVDAETLAKGPSFDHRKVAASLNTVRFDSLQAEEQAGDTLTAITLPFTTFEFVDADH